MSDFKFESQLEANEEDLAVEWAENHGWEARKMAYIGRRSCPDRFFFGHGQIVMIEFKRPGEDLDAGQAREHKRLRAVGLNPLTCRSAKEAIGHLKRCMK